MKISNPKSGIKLSKVALSLSLFSSVLAPSLAYAAQVQELGVATGDNSVAVGQDSIATSRNGIATGHGAVATGGGLDRAGFDAKKQQYDTALQNINTENANINQKNQEISNKEAEINIASGTLNNLRQTKPSIDRKKQEYDDKVRERDAQIQDVTNKDTALTNATTAIDPFRKTLGSDEFITFFDMLKDLDWGSNKTDDELGLDLKTKVDTKFNNAFNYTLDEYKKIIDGYKKREGQISGSRLRLNKELNDTLQLSGLSSSTFSADKLVDSYYNKTEDNRNYISNFEYDSWKTMFNKPESEFHYLEQGTSQVFHSRLSGIGLMATTETSHESINRLRFSAYEIADQFLTGSDAETKNTAILIMKSLEKAKKDNKFTPIFYSFKTNKRIDNYISLQGYGDNPNYITLDFANKYNRSQFDNYSLGKKVRFGFKKINSNEIEIPIGSDVGLLNIIDLLGNNSVEINDFLKSSDIQRFRTDYNALKQYKSNIDWNFTESAIDLDDYKRKLEKVEAYYRTVDSILTLYEEIITERQKPNGGNQDLVNEKSRELLKHKTSVLKNIDDMTNFMAGIELVYTSKASEYLEYGKNEADLYIKNLYEELRLYDKDSGIIKGVNDKIDALKAEYNAAKDAKAQAEEALTRLNKEVSDKELKPEEKAIDQTISDKEREKQALEDEKARLEREKQEAQDRLDAARDALNNSGIKNLGNNSYAHGFKAFASGDNSIAIGTEAVALGNDSIAMGREAKANAEGSVAIGQGAVVTHANSVAIGKGSSTSIGARGANYTAQIGNDQTANFSLGSIGEFSVGSAEGLRQITHVAAGVEDTDAVNVWQLKAAIAAIPRADNNNAGGQPAQPQPSNVEGYNVSGNNITTVNNFKDAFDHINEQGIKYVHVNAGAKKTEPADRSNNDSSASGANSVAIGRLANAVGDKSVALGDNAESRVDNSVALGADSQTSQAKDDNTLGVGNERGGDIISELNNAVNNYAGNAVGVVSVGKKGGERIIQNVAAGLVGANSTDAVNGSQLHALAQAVGRGETGLVRQGNDASRIVNGVNHNRLTVGAGTGGSEISFTNVDGQARRLTGVAEGVEATDAVNKSQLDKAVGRLEKANKQLKGGISNVAAMASLPQAYLPSQGMVSVATGYYRGSSSVAVGLSRVSDNGRVVFKLNGSASQKGDVTAGAGIGFAW